MDLRGHGQSDWAENGDYSIESFAADLCLAALSFSGPPLLVGASLGGISALMAQARAGDRRMFSALVLVDITPTVRLEGADRIRAFMSARLEDGFASLEEAAETIARYLPHRPRSQDLSGLRKNLRLGPDGRYRWHWDPKLMASMRVPRDSEERGRWLDAIRAIEVPVLLVRGRSSELVSEEDVRQFLAILPHAEYVDVSGAGHMVAGDRNDAFTDAVLDFVDALGADPSRPLEKSATGRPAQP